MSIYVLCGLLLLAGSPATLGARQLTQVTGTGVLPQPAFADIGSINTLAANPTVTRRAAAQAPAPAFADQAAPAQAPAALAAPAPAPAAGAEALVAQAPTYKPATQPAAAFGAFAPAPALSKRRRVLPRSTVFILDADYATLTIPDPDQADEGTLELTGFSRHVSYFTDNRGTGVRRSGRLPITRFANTTFPGPSNATANGTAVQPNAALYTSAGSYYGSSDRLLRAFTLHGKPSVDATNTTLTFNVTLAPSSSSDDVVTVYRVSFNATGNGTDMPQVTQQDFGTTSTYESVALYVGNWWWGMDDRSPSSLRREERRERRETLASWFWP